MDMQLISPGPPQLYYTVPLDIAVQATRALNDGIAEYIGRHPESSVRSAPSRNRTARRRPRTRALHAAAQVQGRRDSHQCRPQGIVRSCLCAVLEEAEELGALVMTIPTYFTEATRRRASTSIT